MGFSCFRFSESVHLRLSLNVCCFRPLFLQMFFSTIFFLKMSNILLFSHSFLRFCSTFHSTIESPSAVFFHLLYFSTLNSLSFLPSVSFFIFLSFLSSLSLLRFFTYPVISRAFTIAHWNICMIPIIKSLSYSSNIYIMRAYIDQLFLCELKFSWFFVC